MAPSDHHQELAIPMDQTFAWTDSTIVINWIQGNPHRFKVFVGNRVVQIMELIPPERWKHVVSADNPADCASRGLFPSEILSHSLWWNGPHWLKLDQARWPKQLVVKPNLPSDEADELCSCIGTVVAEEQPLIPLDQYSVFNRLIRVTAWMIRFITNCRSKKLTIHCEEGPLTIIIQELSQATSYWIKLIQKESWPEEINALKKGSRIRQTSRILSLNPFLDDLSILRVGGRQENAESSYDMRHPIILPSKHPLVKILIRSEHNRLLHAGHLLLSGSLSCRYHIVGGHKAIRAVSYADGDQPSQILR